MRRERPSLIGHGAAALHCDLDPVPASVGLARSFVRESAAGLGEDVVDVCVLLTSELVTNAILHARTPVQVGVVVDPDGVVVSVADRVPVHEPLEPRSRDDDRAGGRGLVIVAEASDDWGTAAHANGKSVWFRVPRQACPDRAPVQARTASESA